MVKGIHFPYHVEFSTQWIAWTTELVPNYVKSTYLKDKRHKGKPFEIKDAQFFWKGIEELSHLFTDERSSQIPSYYSHPKYRSSYLLYFLPLQSAKFLALFQTHHEAIDQMLEFAEKVGVLEIFDLGAGPGTASFTLLLELARRKSFDLPIKLHLCDISEGALDEAKLLLSLMLQFEPLGLQRLKIEIKNYKLPWWKIKTTPKTGMILFGNVLNEALNAPMEKTNQAIFDHFKGTQGGGILFVEPAFKKSSQNLSKIRDYLVEQVDSPGNPVFGPCLHSGHCPLAGGKSWCHQSVPARIPGKWFHYFSMRHGSVRDWLKFSYIWMKPDNQSDQEKLIEPKNPKTFRIITDPLRRPGQPVDVFLCEPDKPGVLTLRGEDSKLKATRGALFTIE